MSHSNIPRNSLSRLLAPCMMALLAAACGQTVQNGSGDGGPRASATMGSCDALAQSLLTYIAKCHAPNDVQATQRAQRFEAECMLVFNAPGATGLGATLATCQAAYDAALQACDQVDPSACSPPQGMLPDGSPCGADTQCSSGLCAVSAGGIDAPANYISFLDATSPADAPPAAVTHGGCGMCATTAAEGQACDALPCANGLYCQQGTCTAQLPLGDAGDSCVARACKPGLRCDQTMDVCVPLPKEGERCINPQTGFLFACASPLVCIQAPTGLMATCEQGSAEGGFCSLSGGSACARGLQCNQDPIQNPKGTGICVAPTQAPLVDPGQSCASATACKYGYCAAGTCPKLLADGQACMPDVQSAMLARCDYFSECIGNACALFDPSSCK